MGRANPLRWDCATRGCFNIRKRPKIEVFAECFPGNIQMGDVDGIVEINGQVLMLEWKEFEPISTGQRIMYRRMTESPHCHVIVVVGDPETMVVEKYTYFQGGSMAEWLPGNLDDLKEFIRSWVRFAIQPRSPPRTHPGIPAVGSHFSGGHHDGFEPTTIPQPDHPANPAPTRFVERGG
ncbi:MAG: hypothetical protein HQL90_08040 [Magnetococcales bacterium]|nr:hypothetical protein [Magnetococcales bacterium]